MKVELFYTPGCADCTAAQTKLRAAAEEVVTDLEWREVSAVEELDYAVELGVLTLPSVVIDGKLVFTSMPTPQELREALRRRTAEGK